LKHVADLGETGFPFASRHFIQGSALKEDPSGVRFEEPDDMLEQHALAGSAEPDDRRYLPGVDPEVHAVQNHPGSEAFGDILEFDQGGVHGVCLKSTGR